MSPPPPPPPPLFPDAYVPQVPKEVASCWTGWTSMDSVLVPGQGQGPWPYDSAASWHSSSPDVRPHADLGFREPGSQATSLSYSHAGTAGELSARHAAGEQSGLTFLVGTVSLGFC